MPPLAPNLSQAATLRTISGWNNSSMSRRSNTMRGLLSTRTPQSSDTTSGGMLNPPLPPSIISEAMPRGAAGSFTPRVVLSRPSGGGGGGALPLSTWAGRTFEDPTPGVGRTTTGAGPVTTTILPLAPPSGAFTNTDDGQMLVFSNFTTAGLGSGFNIGYFAGTLLAWQGNASGGFAEVTNISPTTLNISSFGFPGPLYVLTAV